MVSWRIRILALLGLPGLVACAMPESALPPLPRDAVEAELRRQQIAHIRLYYAQIRRLDQVAFKIGTANRNACGTRVLATLGIYPATPQSLPRRYRSYVREALDITWMRPTVIGVAESSPAADAGIVLGDEIVALNGETMPLYATARRMARWVDRNGTKPIRVDLRRDGVDRTVTVTPVLTCAVPVELSLAEETNAATDGEQIVINVSMLHLAKTDSQLAIIVAHELAHATLGHIDKQTVNEIVGLAGGLAIDASVLAGGLSTGGAFARAFGHLGLHAYSVAFEREADYVGAYYAVRAGYELDGAEEIWTAMGQATPDAIRFARTHPATPTRFVQLQRVAAEIAEKRKRGVPLEPNIRIGRATPPMQSGETIR